MAAQTTNEQELADFMRLLAERVRNNEISQEEAHVLIAEFLSSKSADTAQALRFLAGKVRQEQHDLLKDVYENVSEDSRSVNALEITMFVKITDNEASVGVVLNPDTGDSTTLMYGSFLLQNLTDLLRVNDKNLQVELDKFTRRLKSGNAHPLAKMAYDYGNMMLMESKDDGKDTV